MTIPSAQAATAALLRDLAGGAAPIETHISAVFVGAETVWKLKKAVRLGFLDFSTLEAREKFARRELTLNQPQAPGLYRDVVAVTRAQDGSLALGGTGEAVDWVLRMAPVPAEDFLDAIVARGGLTPALLDGVADAIHALHQAAAPAPRECDAPAAAARVLSGNLRDCRATGLPEPRIAALAAAMQDQLAALAPTLAVRAGAGAVRRCHGDLHLGNLCLWQGRPTAFDALEFDEALATTDIGYDLAFPLMDLWHRGHAAAANRVMNRYLGCGGDYGLLTPLPFWMALRALVRAHVEARRGNDGLPWLATAEHLLRPVPPRLVPPRLVAIGGLQGSGKTVLARALAPALGIAPGALHLRSDEVRKRRAGVAPDARLPPEAYAEAESLAVHAEIFAAARQALAAGRSVVLDAVFLDPAHRAAAAAVAGGRPFTGFWLAAPLDVLRARVGARAQRGEDASDATIAVLDRAASVDPGPIDWRVLDATAPLTQARAALALPGADGA